MNKLEKINRELSRVTEEFNGLQSALYEEKVAIIRTRLIMCIYCDRRSRLGRWGLVENLGKPQDLVCPNCGKANNIHHHPDQYKITDLVDRQFVEKRDILAKIWKRNESGPTRLILIHPKQ